MSGPGGLDVLRVADHELTWQLGVATAANRRPGATTEAFLDLLRERHPALRQLGGPDDGRP